MINLVLYDCDISSRGSIIFTKRGRGSVWRVGGVEGEVTKGDRGGVRLR